MFRIHLTIYYVYLPVPTHYACIGTYFQDLDTLTEGLLKFSCGGRYFRHLILNELPLYMRLSAIT